MITLSHPKAGRLKPLDESQVAILSELLALDKPAPLGDYFSSDTHDFIDYFYDVLMEQDASPAINIDWKWHPDDIFWQLVKSFPNHNIKLVEVADDPDYEAYNVRYKFGDKTDTAHCYFARPGQLVESIENHLKDRQFVDLNFGEDAYSWLIVPKSFDTEKFLQITGLVPITYKPIQLEKRQPNLSMNFSEDYNQPNKIFYLPSIFYVEDDTNSYFIRYKESGSDEVRNQIWAGRVLAGQTIREGISTELKSELGYTGRFEYSYGGFESTLKDKQGKDTNRYRFTIFLYDKPSPRTVRGYEIDLQKTTGFNLDIFARL